MEQSDKVEQIILDALNEYSQLNPLAISKVEPGYWENALGNGLSLTLGDGTVYEISIREHR